MGLLVANCPRCSAQKMTFEIKGQTYRGEPNGYGLFEAFSECLSCGTGTIFLLEANSRGTPSDAVRKAGLVQTQACVNDGFVVLRYISLRDHAGVSPPEHLPAAIKSAFQEGAACHAIGAHNAAVCMFRKCLDLATLPMLPDTTVATFPQPTQYQRHNLKPRLEWLFAQGKIRDTLHDLAHCIREDGNEGAHAGSVEKDEAEEILEFTERLLTELFTEPERIKLAKERQANRKAEQKGGK